MRARYIRGSGEGKGFSAVPRKSSGARHRGTFHFKSHQALRRRRRSSSRSPVCGNYRIGRQTGYALCSFLLSVSLPAPSSSPSSSSISPTRQPHADCVSCVARLLLHSHSKCDSRPKLIKFPLDESAGRDGAPRRQRLFLFETLDSVCQATTEQKLEKSAKKQNIAKSRNSDLQ